MSLCLFKGGDQRWISHRHPVGNPARHVSVAVVVGGMAMKSLWLDARIPAGFMTGAAYHSARPCHSVLGVGAISRDCLILSARDPGSFTVHLLGLEQPWYWASISQ